MRILVTGARGQLGEALCGSVRSVAGENERGAEGFEWNFCDRSQLDITCVEAVAAKFAVERPDVVINAAAFTDVDRAETHSAEAFAVNGRGAGIVAEAAARAGAGVIHISTDYVFDGWKRPQRLHSALLPQDRPYTETDRPAPLNIYGESKLAGERAVMESGCRGAAVRTSWLWTPGSERFVPSIVRAARKAVERDGESAEIRVVADQTGCPTSAPMLARSIVGMIERWNADRQIPAVQLYHCCGPEAMSRAEFSRRLLAEYRIPCGVVPVSSEEFPSSAPRPRYSALDCSKFIRDYHEC